MSLVLVTLVDLYAFDDLAIPLLCRLSRRAKDLANSGPGSPCRPSPHHSIDDLPFASSTVQRGTPKDVFLNRKFIAFLRFIRLETLGELIGAIENILD
jgi:hypothetical protein